MQHDFPSAWTAGFGYFGFNLVERDRPASGREGTCLTRLRNEFCFMHFVLKLIILSVRMSK